MRLAIFAFTWDSTAPIKGGEGMGIVEWFRAHMPRRHRFELPHDLREASHRAANESAMIRSEVVQASGGYAAYERKSAELRRMMDQMMDRQQ